MRGGGPARAPRGTDAGAGRPTPLPSRSRWSTQAYNAVHGALRCLGERANSLLKSTFKALSRWRGCPWRIGQVVAAALVVLHHEHRRTT